MDLLQIKPSERTVEILNPATGTALGVRVRIVSKDDDRLKELKRAITDRSIHLQQRNKTFKAEEIEENFRKLLFAATLGWEWYNPTGKEGDDGYDPEMTPNLDGDDDPTFNQRNFMRVIIAAPWFANQINEECDDTKAFFNQSKPS